MEVDSWITITVLVNFIALIFQTGAYAAPMWLWMQTSSAFYGEGLWYSVCRSSPTSPSCTIGIPDEAPWLAVKVLQSVGLAGVLTLAVFLIVYKFGHSGKWGNMETVNLVAFILCILTILILLASAAVYCAYYYKYFKLVENNDKTSLPWSPIMSFIACLILILVCYFIRYKCRIDIIKALPMSGDDKLDLHPHVQNGNANRYYNQTPYIEDKDRFIDDRSRGIRSFEYDHRRNGSPQSFEQRTTYVNRVYQSEPEVVDPYNRTETREVRDQGRDRDVSQTTYYTGNGHSYLKEDVRPDDRYSRPDRDDRYSRPDRDDRYNRPDRDDRYNRPDRDDRYNKPDRDDRYNRPDRDDRFSRIDREDRLNMSGREDRYGRSGGNVEYHGPRGLTPQDEFYDLRNSSRPLPGSSRDVPASSNVYMYRPYQY